MTKGKKWTLRLLGVAALALLICLCLMGSTMARYTSSGTGSGSLTVALWELESVDLDTPGDAFSPSADEYSSDRSNTSAWLDAFTMQNNSKVDADVTFEIATDEDENPLVTLNWADDFTWGTGWTGSSYTEDSNGNPTGKAQTNAYGAEIMDKFGFTSGTEKDQFEALVNSYGIFSLEFGSDPENIGTVTALGTNALNIPAESTADVYCEVVWTSVYDDSYSSTYESFASAAEFSDAIDTIIGMYVKSISFKVTWTAVQASVLPGEPT